MSLLELMPLTLPGFVGSTQWAIFQFCPGWQDSDSADRMIEKITKYHGQLVKTPALCL
jgi:hypothetical protein